LKEQLVEKSAAGPPKVMRSPRVVDIDITSTCNLRCLYCFYFDNEVVKYHDLPAKEWLRFFEELGAASVMKVCIAGGEPFARKDLPCLVEGIVRNRMRFSILSNGSLITEEIAGFIEGTNRCDYIQISVDGSRAEVHEACRGKGSFDGAIRGIKILQRRGLPVTVRVTITRHNVGDLENIARMLLGDLGLPGFGTNAAGYLGSCRQNSSDVLLSTRDREIAMETLLRLSEKYSGRISALAGPLADARFWLRMEDARRRGLPPFESGGRLTGCGCPQDNIAVRADGVIIPCSMLPHMELGNINKDRFLDVWQKSSILNILRARDNISLNSFDYCKECSYTSYCTGNCPGLAYSLTGEVNSPSPDACLHRFLEDGGRLPGKYRLSGGVSCNISCGETCT